MMIKVETIVREEKNQKQPLYTDSAWKPYPCTVCIFS